MNFFEDFCKEFVFQNNPPTLEESKANIENGILNIIEQILAKPAPKLNHFQH